MQRNNNMLQITFDWDEVNSLIGLLHEQGIFYLMGDASSLNEDHRTVDSVSLIQRLAACGYPIVENASIALFILHPELASSVVQALQSSEPNIAENIAVLTLATLYMQEWWFFRLTFALGQLPCFPEEPFVSLWEERHLPPPSSGYGLDGLLTLQEYQQQKYGIPVNVRDDWQNQINHLLTQEETYHRELSDDLKKVLIELSI